MSQRNVEQVIGRLVTDESFRRRFAEDPRSAIEEIAGAGYELTSVERQALACVDAGLLTRIAEAIDPRIQKVDGCRGRW